jgi:hypothetical protein
MYKNEPEWDNNECEENYFNMLEKNSKEVCERKVT